MQTVEARDNAARARYWSNVTRAMRVLHAKCPHCGNTNPELIETNGCEPNDPDFTLLCIARMKPGEEALADFEPRSQPGDDGLVACGMQWEPR